MLSWKDLIEVLSRTLNLAPEKRATLVARIQAMQKPPYSFPPGERVGRGGKAAYSADQLLQLVYVLELLDVGVPPGQATGLVIEQWPMLARATGEALLSPDHTYPRGTFLVIHLSALDGLRNAPTDKPIEVRHPDPESPYNASRGIVGLHRDLLTRGVVTRPAWLSRAALIYVPEVAIDVQNHLSDIGVSTSELLDSARKWIA